MPERYLGRTIGKYRVTRHLGTGAFSWVYEAVDQDLEIPVALKILRPEFAGQEAAESRFRREAATAARLRHPNIVTVRDVGQVEGAAFVAMDLHPLTLGRRLLLVGHLPETDCVRLGIGIAAALAVAHASQVIHRDIKPDNILLDAEGDAVVADFGLARALAASASQSATNQVQGTPHYFSPEQARGQDLDGRSDLYSLGVTLYRSATGHLPFEGDDWYAIARHHIETAPRPLRELAPELTPAFESLVLRLLAKDPAARFANAVQVVDALAALPTAPDRSTALPRLGSHTIEAFRPAGSKRPRMAMSAATLVVAALLLWQTLGSRQNALPNTPPSSERPVPADTLGASAPVRPMDSTAARPGVADSLPAPRDPATRRAAVPVPLMARLEVSASDSAQIYVDNRLVGSGRWSGDHAPASRIPVRAVVANAPISCTTALRDTVLTQIKAGQRISVELAVRSCAVVRYRVEPRDARVAFVTLDGGRSVETRADSAVSLSLPVGRYLLRISAPRCVTFADTVLVQRGGGEAAVPRKLFCG